MSFVPAATTAATGAGGSYAAIANATKASGAIVKMDPHDFEIILSKSESPVVVTAPGSAFSPSTKYLTSYKGIFFFTKSHEPLQFPSKTELISAKKIWIPG